MHALALLLAATAALPCSNEPPQRRDRAVVVGIDTYRHADALPALGLAEADAKDLAAALRAAGFEVRFLLPGLTPPRGRSPRSEAEILAAVREIAQQAGPDDTILFYYSGHGFSDSTGAGYLCTMDTDPDQLRETALRLEVVTAAMRASRAGRRILILDACRNVVGRDVAPQRRMKVGPLPDALGLGVLFSTAPGELSYEPTYGLRDRDNRIVKNGLFTHSLLWGLRGGADRNADGLVSLRESTDHAAGMLAELAARVRQTPTCQIEAEGDAKDLLLCKVIRLPDGGPRDPAPPVTTVETDGSVTDDAPFEAIVLEPDSEFTGSIGEGLDRSDWFKLQTTQPGRLTVILQNTGAERAPVGNFVLRDDSGSTLQATGFLWLAPGQERPMQIESIQDYRRYYLEIQADPSGKAASYRLQTRFEQMVAEDVGEPNHAPEVATELQVEDGKTCWIGLRGDEADHFVVRVAENGALRVQVRNQMIAGTQHALIAPVEVRHDGEVVAATHPNGIQPGDEADTRLFTVEGGADYRIVVRPIDGSHSTLYQVITSFVRLEIGDVDEPHNRSLGKASALPFGIDRTATLGYRGDTTDVWKVEAESTGYVRFSVQNLHDGFLHHSHLGAPVVSDRRAGKLFDFHPNGLLAGQEQTSALLPIAADDRLYAQCNRSPGPHKVPYRIRAEFVELPIEAETGRDGNDAPDNPTALVLEEPVEQTVGFGRDPVDWYSVTVSEPGTLYLNIANLSPKQVDPRWAHLASVEVTDPNGDAVLGSSHPNGIAAEMKDKAVVGLPAAGRYLIRLRPVHELGAVPYLLESYFEADR